jgi:predicted O-linked N-acetylglucosamine transferase (SPINDLY family)
MSILRHAGFGEWIAGSREEYVAKAAELAGDVARVAEVRESMRERLRGSVLMDRRRFGISLEGALRRMWQAWCGGT